MEEQDIKKKTRSTMLLALLAVLVLYILMAWAVFQWRNPLSNGASFYRHFYSVERLP